MENEKIFERFVEIWKPDFLAKNIEEIESSKTWKFWFLSNSIVSFILIIILSLGIIVAVNEAGKYLEVNYPNAKVVINNGKLSTEGIQEPIFYQSDKSVFVLDTQENKYDASILDNFDQGVFISGAKIINKKNSIENREFNISNFKNVTITEKDLVTRKWIFGLFFIVFVAIFIWIYFNVFRLVSALWWALLFWLLALIMKVKDVTFSKVYFSVLNFYIIPLVASLLLLTFGTNIPFLTFVIFLVLFIVNYRKLNEGVNKQLQIDLEDQVK